MQAQTFFLKYLMFRFYISVLPQSHSFLYSFRAIEEYLFLRTKPSQNLFKFASLNLKRNELCQ